MRLIGYARVSTDDQAREGHSMGQQPKQLQAYCDLYDHTLVRVIVDEGISASVPLRRRPGGPVLLDALRAGEAEGVVVVRLDRLFRDAEDGLNFFNGALKRCKASVHSIGEHIDTSTPAGRFNLLIQLGAAQYERELIAQRATECNAALRGAGKVYGCVPYGCIERDGMLYRVAEVWRMREWIVHNLRHGTSLRIQQAALADAGVRSPTGKARWSLNTLWGLQHHHDELARLPFVDQLANGAVGTGETGVSGGLAVN